MPFYFIVQPVGQHYTVQCPIPSAPDTTVWVTREQEILIPPQLSNGTGLMIQFNPIKDTDHDKIFACQSSTSDMLRFTILGVGKSRKNNKTRYGITLSLNLFFFPSRTF